MDQPAPLGPVRAAVLGAVRWYRAAALRGYRVEKVNGSKVLVADAAARVWPRFAEVASWPEVCAARA